MTRYFTVKHDVDDEPDCEGTLEININEQGITCNLIAENEPGCEIILKTWSITPQQIADELLTPTDEQQSLELKQLEQEINDNDTH